MHFHRIKHNAYFCNSRNQTLPLLSFLLATILTIFSNHDANCQWEPLDGPYGGFTNELKNNDQFVFAATPDGLFRSIDGETWEASRFITNKHLACLQIGVLDSLIVAEAVDASVVPSKRQMFKSVNNGETWTEISRPPSDIYLEIELNSYGIYVRDYQNFWASKDMGTTWTLSHFPQDSFINYLTSNGKNILLACNSNLYQSSPNADKWSLLASTPLGTNIDYFYQEDDLLMATDPGQNTFLRSTDGGLHWEMQQKEFWGKSDLNIVKIGNEYFTNLNEGIYHSPDAGFTWLPSPTQNYPIELGMIQFNNSLILGSYFQGIFKSTDFGQTFQFSSKGITATHVQCIAFHQNSILATSTYMGVFDYNLSQETWNSTYMPKIFRKPFDDLVSFNDELYLISDNNTIYRYRNGDWMGTTSGNCQGCSEFFVVDGNLYVGGNTLSSRGRLNIKYISGGWGDYEFEVSGQTIVPYCIASNAEFVFASDVHNFYRKPSNSETWEKIEFDSLIGGNPYQEILGLYAFGGKVIIIQFNFKVNQYRILMSGNNGESWNYENEDFPTSTFGNDINTVFSVGSYLLVTTSGQGVIASPIEDIQWFEFNEGLPNLYINDLTFDEEFIYAATSHQGVWRRKISDLFTTSFSSLEVENELNIYPNPANQSLHVSLNDNQTDKGEIALVNLQGQILSKKIFTEDSASFDVSDLPPGLYVVIYQSNEFYKTEKVIIHH